ncbi:helix-turn-helix domain-containing protein [uncultured Sphingomonas sp.]|uniref:helix-turn-helix domain-containing protein n=1 Tax=uncultured Sphingomonas sp. TaxID=158754 RepID=UPI0025D32437|nr:helix-turn-helix domain-containing protein [uncultured Sphingomonas sp.]
MTVVAMSRSELSRYETLQRVERGEITANEAGELLRLCRRQVYRLLDRFRADGAAGLISPKRGRPSNRRLSETYRDQILGIVRERYADFGPTLAVEYLAERHALRCRTRRCGS